MAASDPPHVFQLNIPRMDGGATHLELKAGQTLFVLGPNGTGKSALMQHLYREHEGKVVWIQAHRRSSTPYVAQMTYENFFSAQGRQHQANLGEQARYIDPGGFYAQKGIQALIYNHRANAVALYEAAHKKEYDEVERLLSDMPLDKRLTSLFQQSNLAKTIRIIEDSVLVEKRNGRYYGVDRMSDGERNALLLMSNVITAPPQTLLLIDEPETHLHRSIASPLLSNLFALRRDCGFVVATHQIALPLDDPDGKVVLIRGCTLAGSRLNGLDITVIDRSDHIPPDVREAILGGRKTIVFVEGESSSLDQPFYASLLPTSSVIPMGGCRAVIDAVKTMSKTEEHHHTKCFGVIDADHRDEHDLEALKEGGIFAVDGYSVESIFYDEEIQRKVVAKFMTDDDDQQQRVSEAKENALHLFGQRSDFMCRKSAEAKIRQEFSTSMNTVWDDENESHIRVPTQEVLKREKEMFERAVENRDLNLLIRRYPVKRSGALKAIVKALGFTDTKTYEQVVIGLLQDDEGTRRWVRGRFTDLLAEIEGKDDRGAQTSTVG